MRRIAIINQKGGVGKTTTTANLGAALAIQGRRVVLVDMDAQANLSLALGVEARSGTPTAYSVLSGDETIGACLRATSVPRLQLVASNIDLSGAELELASAMGREFLLRDALREWEEAHEKAHGTSAADYVLFDCPPSLGLLSINALAASGEVLITLQTEFLALQGMSKLVEILQLLKKRLNPDLTVAGIVPTLYDSRLKLAREVLGDIRRHFKDLVVPHPVRANVKLAEAPSFAQTIFEYAPDSHGAVDYMHLARELILREERDPRLAGLPPFDPAARLPVAIPETTTPARRPPPPRKKSAAVIVPAPRAVAPARDVPAAPAGSPATATPPVAAAPTATSRSVRSSAAEPARAGPPAEKPAESRAVPSQETPSVPGRSTAARTRARTSRPVPRTARIDDVPPLPPDAFEILSTPIDP